MKNKIAILLTLIMAAGTFTACTVEEKVNNSSLSPTASTSVGVSVSETTSKISETSQAETTTTTETETTEKATVSQETNSAKKDTKSKEKSDTGQNSANVSATEPTKTVQSSKTENKSTTQKATKAPTQKPTQPPTQKTTEKKKVDISSAVSSVISYGKQLGMHYDGSLNTGNASWFSPTNASYYDSTSQLTVDLKSDVEYTAYYYKSDGVNPSDLSFNVVAENNKIYVVYC